MPITEACAIRSAMEISTNPEHLRAYRTGKHHLLPGAVSPLGDACSQCGRRVALGDAAVLANDAMGWQIAHPACVGSDATQANVAPVEAISIDYLRGKQPMRQAIVEAAKQRDRAYGSDGFTLMTIARSILDKAADGDMQAARDLADRLDGKPSQQMEMDVHISLEQLILQSITLEKAAPDQVGHSLDTEPDRIVSEQ